MMQFNIDYVTNYFYKGRGIPKRTLQDNIKSFIKPLNHLQCKLNSIAIRKAFIRIFVSRRPRVEKLTLVDRMIRRRLSESFFNLKRKTAVNIKTLTSSQNKHSYPVTLLIRLIARKCKQNLSYAFGRLKSNQKYLRKISGQLSSVIVVHKEYISRNIKSDVFRALVGFSRRKSEYLDHISSLEYLLDCIRVRIVFFAFAQMSVKTVIKNINQLEKQRVVLREKARSQHVKKNEIENDLKRKIHNLAGKINQQKINNNSIKVNKTRQNGMKLTKLNQKLRVAELEIEYDEYDLQRMQNQLKGKEQCIQSRGSNPLSLQELQNIYNCILQSEETQKSTNHVINKLIPKQKIAIFKDSLLFHVRENARLKQLMSIYERSGSIKTDSYNNVNNENTSLKDLISSLIYHQINGSQAQDMISTSQAVDEETKKLRQQLRKLRASTE